ncbi:phosphoribosylamine--glycine ligase [bacterium]|nr:phosphoribosylamine--glycine ligase [bacterium]
MTALPAPQRILVVGNGARENALASAILLSPAVQKLWITPANWGLLDPPGGRVECLDIAATDLPGLLQAAQELAVDLVVIGPEAPLVLGLADRLRAAGIPCVGPGEKAALLEGSKSFAKDFMQRCGIPTARYLAFEDVFSDSAPLRQAIEQWPAFAADGSGGLVLKADGLAAGKGVVVCADKAEALAAFERMVLQQEFGRSADTVVLEERLSGPEISFTCLLAGGRAEVLPPSSDYKRLQDGDLGPNTGGMGNICPTPWATDEVVHDFAVNILAPFMRGLREDGLDYRGFLFVGTMLTERGLKVIEFNVRFGDPEAAVVIPLCEADWAGLLASIAAGELPQGDSSHSVISLREGACVAVVLASEGYPLSKAAPQPIQGLDRVAARGLLEPGGTEEQGWLSPDVSIFFAGVGRRPRAAQSAGQDAGASNEAGQAAAYQPYPAALADWEFTATGGRVLTISARGADLSQARRLAYEIVGNLRFEGMQYRSDIGKLP